MTIHEAPAWKADKLRSLRALLEAALFSVKPSRVPAGSLRCTAHLQGSSARGTAVWYSNGDFVLDVQQATAKSSVPHTITRNERGCWPPSSSRWSRWALPSGHTQYAVLRF